MLSRPAPRDDNVIVERERSRGGRGGHRGRGELQVKGDADPSHQPPGPSLDLSIVAQKHQTSVCLGRSIKAFLNRSWASVAPYPSTRCKHTLAYLRGQCKG
jgi:hypothetical protein